MSMCKGQSVELELMAILVVSLFAEHGDRQSSFFSCLSCVT